MTSAVALLTQVWVGDIVLLACLDNLQGCQRVICVSEDTTCALVACTHAAVFFKLRAGHLHTSLGADFTAYAADCHNCNRWSERAWIQLVKLNTVAIYGHR
jgi:hypothetical protein